ncbi:MAG: FtsX-like permease family protein, partial [Acidimicrobiales bacterium]
GISSPSSLVVLAAALGLVLIGLVSIAGFTVIAQRRLRSLGMIRALGATDRHVRSVVLANGLLVGVTSVVTGSVLGLVVWVFYRPDLERTQHHVIGLWQLPWLSIAGALALALLTPILASARPGRTVSRVPVVAALAGRPSSPKNVARTALPGVVVMIVSFLLLGDAARSSGSAAPLLLGFVALAVGTVLLAPTFVASLAGIRRAPLAMRLAVRDLVRYRARSASTLAAISIGVLTAMVVMIATTARYANVLDYVGPNMTSTQLVVYAQNQSNSGPTPAVSITKATAVETGIANSLHATGNVALYMTSATLNRAAPGRQYSGPLYVATPALLKAFHVPARSLNPAADVLTARPGFAGISQMQLVWGGYFGGRSGPHQPVCRPSDCLPNPVMQEVGALPLGTSLPNTVITEHALTTLHLSTSEFLDSWLITSPQPLTTTQIAAARQTAGAAGMSIESKSSLPTTAEIVDYATGAALLIALFVLAMSIGLIRAESAGDRRTLTATGASSWTRRSITAATGGTLALLGAVLGSVGAYVATAAFFSNSTQNETGSLLGSLTHVPALNLGFIFLGLPLLAFVGGWLLAGREPRDAGRTPA